MVNHMYNINTYIKYYKIYNNLYFKDANIIMRYIGKRGSVRIEVKERYISTKDFCRFL